MPVKTSPSKKASKEIVIETEREETEDSTPATPKKGKEPVELDVPESTIDGDGKAEDDPPTPSEDDEEFEDSMGTDEETDPFGDKWEA